jgi:hypothetical protein
MEYSHAFVNVIAVYANIGIGDWRPDFEEAPFVRRSKQAIIIAGYPAAGTVVRVNGANLLLLAPPRPRSVETLTRILVWIHTYSALSTRAAATRRDSRIHHPTTSTRLVNIKRRVMRRQSMMIISFHSTSVKGEQKSLVPSRPDAK